VLGCGGKGASCVTPVVPGTPSTAICGGLPVHRGPGAPAERIGRCVGRADLLVVIDDMCNLYSITTNQAAIIALFRVVNRYVGNLAPMPGVFPDYPAPVVRNTDHGSEPVTMR
jgi:hypothetical protein